MSNTVSLRAFQESLAQRLRVAATDAVPDSRLAVLSGKTRWLLRLNDVGEILPMNDIAGRMVRVPLTRPWHLGLANVRGSLAGVVDFSLFAGGAPTVVTPAARIVLVAEQFQFHCALLVDRMIGLRNPQRFVADEALAAQQDGRKPWQGRRLRDSDGNAWLELDIPALLADEDFLRAGC